MSEDITVYWVGDTDGKLRVAVDRGEDEPPYMPSAARAHGTTNWPAAVAIVGAVPTTKSDEKGMCWQDKKDAEKAARAAAKALGARFGGRA